MMKKDLIARSPLRILEKSIRGGVGTGNIGVIASQRGVGKTACLVHIALDKLFQEKHVIHLSFSKKTNHIVDWYDLLFQEIAEKRNLENSEETYNLLTQNRVIMNFNQAGITVAQVIRSLTALISDGHFHAEVIVIDGYAFEKGQISTLQALRTFAEANKITIWATADIEDDANAREVPAILLPFVDEIAVLVNLQNREHHIELALIKDHDRYVEEDLHLKLEARTLLITEE